MTVVDVAGTAWPHILPIVPQGDRCRDAALQASKGYSVNPGVRCTPLVVRRPGREARGTQRARRTLCNPQCEPSGEL